MQPRGIFCLLCTFAFVHFSLHAQQWDWVQRFSGDSTVGTAVGVDEAQNVYVAGTFSGTNYIGTNRITSGAGDNLFIAKFDSFGTPLWTTTASGVLTKMLVASNGSVFVCGNLTLRDSSNVQTSSNVFLARLDEGSVAWMTPLPQGDAAPASMAFGPDETVYVLASTNRAFIRRYAQDGELLTEVALQADIFASAESGFVGPQGIAVGRTGEVYVFGRRRAYADVTIDFAARVSVSGEVIWTWDAAPSAYFTDHYLHGIAAAIDGGVVVVGRHSNPIPQRSAFAVKISPMGTQEWSNGVFAYSKGFHSAEAVTVDARGTIYVTGYTDGSYYNAERLLILTLSPFGEKLSRESIESYVKGDRNAGKAIAVDKDGAVIVTGILEGQTIFGTNKLSYAPKGGFVARRSTILPELTQRQVGNDTLLSWPATALPFALQQSTDGGSNWSFVAVEPQRSGWRNQTTLPAASDTLFRLLRTNEVRTLHPPRIFPLYVPGISFLSHTQVVIIGSPNAPASRLGAYFEDEDDDPLTVNWRNLQTGEAITNSNFISKYPGVDDRTIRHGTYYGASVALDASMFSPGLHSNEVSVSVSDGTSTVTSVYPDFEAIRSETALAEFLSALDALRNERAGRQAALLWEAWRRAKDRGREKLAAQRWRHFERQLQRVSSLDMQERGRLLNAAVEIQAVLHNGD